MVQGTNRRDNCRSALDEEAQVEPEPIGTVLQFADGSIQACDPATEQLLGYRAEQLIGTTSFDPPWQTIYPNGTSFPPENHPAIVSLRSGQPCKQVVMGFYQPSGKLVWLDLSSTPLFQPDRALPYAVVVTLRPATVPQAIQPDIRPAAADCTEARLQLERFHFLVEHASESIALITKDCRFHYVNRAFCREHGYSRDELRSMRAYDIKVGGSLADYEQL